MRNKSVVIYLSIYASLFMLASCGNKKISPAKASAGLLQQKESNGKMIVMEMKPCCRELAGKMLIFHHYYKIKLLLRNNGPVFSKISNQYMTTGIRNSFFIVSNTDTLPCAICERIPGTRDNEWLYISFFRRSPDHAIPVQGLDFIVDDKVAGFGKTFFHINNKQLQKLDD